MPGETLIPGRRGQGHWKEGGKEGRGRVGVEWRRFTLVLDMPHIYRAVEDPDLSLVGGLLRTILSVTNSRRLKTPQKQPAAQPN